MRWAGNVAALTRMKYIQKFGFKSLKGRGHSGDKGADERKKLKWILKKYIRCLE
jgi:hypothetical protein